MLTLGNRIKQAILVLSAGAIRFRSTSGLSLPVGVGDSRGGNRVVLPRGITVR